MSILTKKILVVEDDSAIAEAVESVLNSENYQAISATTVAQAMQLLESDELSLVLLDLKMPDGDGLDVLHHIRQQESNLPVIMMTGVNDVKRAVECMKAGAQDYLRKPFARRDLLDAVGYEISRASEVEAAGGIKSFEEEEKQIIKRALELTRWRVNEAATQLKIGRATIYRKIERYGLMRPGSEPT